MAINLIDKKSTLSYNVYTMYKQGDFMIATIQKWGNSNAIRFPKVLLEELSLKENDQVSLSLINNSIQIKKCNKHRTLNERFKTFYGKNKKSYPALNENELITGSVGDEI